MNSKNVGSIVENFHEGSRSEPLAEFVLRSFGTAFRVPHEEDTAVDLYCTLTEQIGRLAWPRHHYTVQVKSDMEPWEFGSANSVRWLVEYPLPLFLCVVDKAETRLRLYQTFPRFLVWIGGALPTHLTLVPEEGSHGSSVLWKDDTTYSLSAPVLDMRVSDLGDKEVRENARAVIEFWVNAENRNLVMAKAGVPNFGMPSPYETNSAKALGTSWQGAGAGWGIDSMRDIIASIIAKLGDFYWRRNELGGMARVAVLSRYLWPKPDHDTLAGALADLPFVQPLLNEALRKNNYVFAGVDELSKRIDELLASDLPRQHRSG